MPPDDLFQQTRVAYHDDMALLILAYPNLPQDELAWLADIRAAHDPLHDVVSPHITLVFAVRDISAPRLIEHVRTITCSVQPFQVVFRCASVVKDVLSDHTGVFVVPDEGHAALIRLHDRLYTGPLVSQLRLDVPYIPHITVGSSSDSLACKRLADSLNGKEFCLSGAVDALDVVRYEDGRVETIARLPLG